MKGVTLLIILFWSSSVLAGESIHSDSTPFSGLTYYEAPKSLKTFRLKAKRRRLKDEKRVDEDIILTGDDGSSLVIASPIIESGANVDEINIIVDTGDITFIAK